MGMCLAGGVEEDGWMWLPCGQKIDDLMGVMPSTTLGFVGHPGSNYYRYMIGTGDTTYATLLTKELEQLGFKKESPHPESSMYLSDEYPGLDIKLAEVRSASIVPKRKDEARSRYNKPLVELPEDIAISLSEQGFDSYDYIPNLIWVFRATVRK